MRWRRRPKRCTWCGGSGQHQVYGNVPGYTLPCYRCKGTGVEPVDVIEEDA